MQPLNFTQLSSKKHKAVRIWFLFSSALIGILLGVCTYLTMYQWKRYTTAKIASRANPVPLKSNKKVLYKNNATSLLKTVSSKLTEQACLETFQLSDASIEFRIAGNTAKVINDIAQKLTSVDTQIQLAGLEQPTKNKVIGVFNYQNSI